MRASTKALWAATGLGLLALCALCLLSGHSPKALRRRSLSPAAVGAVQAAGVLAVGKLPVSQLRGSFDDATDNTDPDLEDDEKDSKSDDDTDTMLTIAQLVFAVCFYFIVVNKYPQVSTPNEKSTQLAKAGEMEICCGEAACNANCCLSCWCQPARQGLNFHATGTCNYWSACCCSLFFPMCTTFYGTACTDMHDKVGGEPEGYCRALVCACCCPCCVVLKRAEAIDAAAGVKAGCCSVTAQAREGMGDPLLV